MSDGDCNQAQAEAEATLVITGDGRLRVYDLPYELLEEVLAALEELVGPVGPGNCVATGSNYVATGSNCVATGESLFGPVGLCG